ncbi:unnamed protein product [Cochlearia groenlandica]
MTDLIFPSKRRRAPSFSDKPYEFSVDHFAASAVTSQSQVKHFLDLCRFCKKNVQNGDVFMYGYFGAFCTKECREKQMACDMFIESSIKLAKAKKGRTMCETKSNEYKDESLGQEAESIEPPQFYIC